MIKVRCPICQLDMPGQMVEWPDYPFCSPRCRKIDLGRWLSESYRLPASDSDQSDDSSADDTDHAD